MHKKEVSIQTFFIFQKLDPAKATSLLAQYDHRAVVVLILFQLLSSEFQTPNPVRNRLAIRIDENIQIFA